MKKQIQSYYSKLTHLISGGIWIRTHKVRLQSPGTSPLHHQERRCVKGITNALLCAITGAQRKRVAHWTVDLVDAEWRVCE